MKKIIAALGLMIAFGSFSEVQALPWQSNRTTIQELDNVCWGDRLLDEVQTNFQGKTYQGFIDFGREYKTNGCQVGDRFQGSFQVRGANKTLCEGQVTVTILTGQQADIEWDLINPKIQQNCPIQYSIWQTRVSQINPDDPLGIAFTTAKVGSIPTKVRTAPNGIAMCQLSAGQDVRITSQPYNGWYRTDACGSVGYIYDEDLEFSPLISP